jgi:hypothetical protein
LLEELSLLQLEPDPSREGRGAKLTQEIRNAPDPLKDPPADRYSLARSSVLKELAEMDSDEYEKRLSEFIPQLAICGHQASPFRSWKTRSRPSTERSTFRIAA